MCGPQALVAAVDAGEVRVEINKPQGNTQAASDAPESGRSLAGAASGGALGASTAAARSPSTAPSAAPAQGAQSAPTSTQSEAATHQPADAQTAASGIQAGGGTEAATGSTATAAARGGSDGSGTAGLQTIVANIDVLDAQQSAIQTRVVSSGWLPTQLQAQTSTPTPLNNSLQALIDAVSHSQADQVLEQLTQQTAQAAQQTLQSNAQTPSTNTSTTTQTAQTPNNSQQPDSSSMAQQQWQAHASKLAQLINRSTAASVDELAAGFVSEMLALTMAGGPHDEPGPLPNDPTLLADAEHALAGSPTDSRATSQTVGTQFTQAPTHATQDEPSAHDGYAFDLASLPVDSEAHAMVTDANNHISPTDPKTFFYDADSGKLLLRAGEGPWVVFDQRGQMQGLWRPHNRRDNLIKIGARGPLGRRKERSCKTIGECDREGLPSCCQQQGTF